MSITLNTLAYVQDAFLTPNKVQYVGPSHSFAALDVIHLSRQAPKPTTTFAGIGRSEMKRSKTVTLADGSKAVAFAGVYFHLPVGISDADADAIRDDVADFALSADAGSLAKKHDLIV